MEKVLYAAIGAAALVVGCIAYKMRDELRWWAAVIGSFLVVVCVCPVLFRWLNFQPWEMIICTSGMAVLVYDQVGGRTRRSRHIPSHVRAHVIQRDCPDGTYDARTHHIDHIWPYSKGGSHTSDNLRVIPKEDNLRKGSKVPHISEIVVQPSLFEDQKRRPNS